MRLRDALDLCTDDHAHEWVEMPSDGWGKPATLMLPAMFDPGVADDPRTRPLTGDHLAVYEPDARLSLVWPVPADDDHIHSRDRNPPEWTENDAHTWKNVRPGWAVVLLHGAPIWQDLIWYLDWGSGIGGWVPHFSPVFGEDDENRVPTLAGWKTDQWSIKLVGLINSFSHTWREFANVEPTARLVPNPSTVHPVDAARPEF
jgi:hypothetical protein